jgi:hypothetical protein
MASDLSLAFATVVLPKDHPALKVTPYAVWPLYWGAQALIMTGFYVFAAL